MQSAPPRSRPACLPRVTCCAPGSAFAMPSLLRATSTAALSCSGASWEAAAAASRPAIMLDSARLCSGGGGAAAAVVGWGGVSGARNVTALHTYFFI